MKKFFLSKKMKFIAGVDEVGCGSLVGSVVAASVILYPEIIMQKQLFFRLFDSKILNEKKRLRLYKSIQKYSFDWSVGYASVTEIDCLNILKARLLAMERSIYNLSVIPDLVLVDGNYVPRLKNIFCQCFVKGDSRIPMISAASIIAKVTRDKDMMILDNKYPKYRFAQNKGYPTNYHLQQLKLYGPTIYHRKSFAPIKYMI